MRKWIRSRLPLSGTLCAVLLMCALVALQAKASVSLSFTNSPSGVTTTNGTVEWVTAVAATNNSPVISSVTLWFQTLAPNCTNLWNVSAMSTTGVTNTFRAVIPCLPAGSVNYYAACIYSDDGSTVSTNISATNSFTVGTTNLASARQQNFSTTGWSNSGSNWWNTAGWTGTCVKVGFQSMTTDPDIPTNNPISSGSFLYLNNNQGGFMQSPVLAEGMGSIYFCAVIRNNGYDSGVGTATFLVQTSTDGTNWHTWSWSTNVVTGSTILRVTNSVNINQSAMMRFYRPNNNADDSGNLSAIVIDNVSLSLPPANLALAQPTTAFGPPYPQTGDQVTLFCNTQDINTNLATINRRVVAWYTNQSTTGWTFSPMTNTLGALNQYSTVLPAALGADTNQYYFQCNFDGYYYTNIDKLGVAKLPVTAPTGAVYQYTINASNFVAFGLVAYSDLSFGNVGTNVTAQRTLTVANSGNIPLNVFSNTCPDAFYTSATNFQVAAGGSTNITIFFAPYAATGYGGTITFYSNMTQGTNTINASGTGIVAEACVVDSLAGPVPSAGYRTQILSFTAEGTNNYGYPVQYRFDWGDGHTSVWGAVTASGAYFSTNYAWTSPGNFNVYVQSRAAVNTNVLSQWNGPILLAITNTRIISVTSSLSFGNVATGATASLMLAITNSGIDTLTISGINYSSPFSVSPISFTVAPGNSTNVTAYFSPTATGVFSSALTILSDATSGSDVTAVTGTGEMLSQPVLTGPGTGTINVPLSFSAVSTDSSGNNIQYLFDWGNGTTSGWGIATTSGVGFAQTNAWPVTNNYAVRALARSALNTNIMSMWSVASSLILTNNRIISVGGSLAFGAIVTNLSATMTMTVANTGNGPLTVSAISCPSCFSATQQTFQVTAGGTSNVVITFTPTAVVPYGGTISVLSDATSGGNTILVSGSGLVMEAVSPPIFTGPIYGVRGDLLTYTNIFSADNWGNSVEYRVNWADGQISGWFTNAFAAHTWTNFGVYTISMQAGSLYNTNVLSAWSSNTVSIYDLPIVAFGAISNGAYQPITVNFTNAAAGSVSNVDFFYSPPGSAFFATLGLATNTSGFWTNSIPPLTPGVMSYYLQYMENNGALTYPASSNLTFNIITNLPYNRQQDFNPANGWSNSGSNWMNTAGWTGTCVKVGFMATATDPDVPANNPISSGTFLYLNNNAGAFMQSPMYSEGIGCIYFDAAVRLNSTASFLVQVSTDGTNWNTYGTYVISGSMILHPVIYVNLRQPAMVRFYRPNNNPDDSGGQSDIVLDNVVISMPPADIMLAEQLYNPGYPNSKDPVMLQCMVSDVASNSAPTVNRRMTCYYRYQTDPSFTATNMTDAGGGLFQVTIPAHPQGTMSYYFKCTFDGYYFNYNIPDSSASGVANSEQIGAEYLPFVATNTVPPYYLTYNIRLFRSENQGVSLQATPSSASMNMDLVDDYKWQALVSVNNITNLSWFFNGSLYYISNALAFNPLPQYWGDTNQDFPYPPLGGTTEPGSNTQMQAILNYNGFLVFQFNTRTGDYLVKRAVFQDFNSWQASQNNFDATYGLYTTVLYTNDFSAWGVDQYNSLYAFQNEDFEEFSSLNSASVGVWCATPFFTSSYWGLLNGEVVSENGGYSFQMGGSQLAPGQVWNTASTVTKGIQTYSFNTRLTTAGINNPAMCITNFYNTVGSFWGNSYRAVSTNHALAMSAGANVSVSMIMCYQQPPMVPPQFYEFRLAQVSPSQMQLQLYRWQNGVAAPVPNCTSVLVNYQLTDPTPFVMDFAWTNNGTVSAPIIAFTGAVFRAGSAIINVLPTTTTWTDYHPTAPFYGGVVGFNYSDTVPEIRTLDIYDQTRTNDVYSCPGFSSSDTNNWYFGQAHSDGSAWWQPSGTGAVGYLVAPLPTNGTLNLYTAITDGDGASWTNVFSANVTSLTYQAISVPLNNWQQLFVKLQFAAGDVPAMVDNILCTPWRAVTRDQADTQGSAKADGVSYYNWTTTTEQYDYSTNEPSWTVLEGWITNKVSGITTNTLVEFDRTRANPALDQGILAPVMTNGLGSLSFQATVVQGASVVYRVEATDSSSLSLWNEHVQTFTNTVGDQVNLFVPLKETETDGKPRRMRIVLLPSSSANAVLDIDNLVARDYPPSDPTAWSVYNALVARPSTNNNTADKAFEPQIMDHQTCYLNNDPTNGVLGAVLGDDNPYLQSPQVGVSDVSGGGIGEIAFWARAWATNNPAHVTIKAAPTPDTPPSQWTTLTNLTIAAGAYYYYDFTFFDTQDTVVRFYTSTNSADTNGYGRLCMDNVLVAEPIRAGFDVLSVVLNPVQPLTTNTVGITATIGHFLMHPTNIQLFASYYVGTNTWGYLNWRGNVLAPSNLCHGASVITIPLQPQSLGSTTYITTTNVIPAFATANTVVQYVVWGIFDNLLGTTPIFETTNVFVNPHWYYPTDLNKTYAASGTNWSPYYFVYSCPPGSVWFNEFNYVASDEELYGAFMSEEYVELCGWASTDVSGWRIDILDPTNPGSDPTTGWSLNASISLPGGAKLSDDHTGWGFLVWGDVELLATVPGRLDYAFDDTQGAYLFPYITQVGAMRLVRSNGAYEQLLGYSDSAYYANNMVANGYECPSAYKNTAQPRMAPLELIGNGSAYTNFTWAQLGNYSWSPGSANNAPDQTLTPRFTFFAVVSDIDANGWQTVTIATNASFDATTNVSLDLLSGTAISIAYNAASWYRINTITTNGALVPGASGATQYVWNVASLQTSYINIASNRYVSPLDSGASLPSNVPTAWLAGWGIPENLFPNAVKHSTYSTLESYWLNMNPVNTTNDLLFRITGFNATNGYANAHIQLLVDGTALDALNGSASLHLTAKTNVTDATWSSITNLTVIPATFDASGNGDITTAVPGSNRFFHLEISAP